MTNEAGTDYPAVRVSPSARVPMSHPCDDVASDVARPAMPQTHERTFQETWFPQRTQRSRTLHIELQVPEALSSSSRFSPGAASLALRRPADFFPPPPHVRLPECVTGTWAGEDKRTSDAACTMIYFSRFLQPQQHKPQK